MSQNAINPPSENPPSENQPSEFTSAGPELLREWDNAHVWHPFAPMSAYTQENAPIIVRGEGFDLIDTDGNRYLDGISSLWCNVHGHTVPQIDDAVRRQLGQVAHTTLLGLSSEPSIRLARALVQRAPKGLNRVFYSDSGATSVEVALKMAYQFHRQKPEGPEDRDTFLCVGNAYHGDTLGTVSVGGIDLFHRCYRHLLFQTLTLPSPVALRVPTGYTKETWLQFCFDETARLIQQNKHRLAGVVMEPLVQGAAGILIHPDGFLRHIRELCTENDVPLIADEVAVGFGRTGKLFACEHEDVQPDFLCVAKGISGGYLPLAATITTDRIYEAFLGDPSEGRTFFHGHTYTGNPLGCAAGLASLELFEVHRVLENVNACAEAAKECLSGLCEHPHVAEIRQKGLMIGIELVRDKSSLTPFESPLRIGHQVTLAARKQGVIIRPLGDVVVLMPAPAMPIARVRQLCNVTIACIDEVTKAAAL
ncbi:MAG: adenosylmethionine--8-amino-7-oxononanoate transaminase [Planctomycetaceae bacterium]|nr:adenosylmethionine--8-amino-7-oxononanoate transaminase [Planctomycetaceae bacterium]